VATFRIPGLIFLSTALSCVNQPTVLLLIFVEALTGKVIMDGQAPYKYKRIDQVDNITDSLPPQHDTSSGKANATVIATTADETTKSTDQRADITSAKATRSARQSLSVSWTAISGFVVTFATMLIGLEIIYRYSERHFGLASSSSSKHYLWTYGPTAGEKAISANRGAC
jgi:hypothetical protein